MDGLIDSTEMYLRTVLELEEEGIPALRARLTERLDLSAPSVSEGVGRLQRDGLVELAGDRTVQLTAAGREIATHVMRKHRLAERLLVDVLGLEREFVHEEACRWEHVISDRVEQKLIDFLGSPTTSPYGNPIPGMSDVNEERMFRRLTDLPDGRVVIERISEQLQGDEQVMAGMRDLGLRTGAIAMAIATDGGVELRVGSDSMDLDATQAALVYVSAVE